MAEEADSEELPATPTGKTGHAVRTQHVKSHTGVRGNEAADKLANRGAEISEGHRFVERGSAEPPREKNEHKDNG